MNESDRHIQKMEIKIFDYFILLILINFELKWLCDSYRIVRFIVIIHFDFYIYYSSYETSIIHLTDSIL